MSINCLGNLLDNVVNAGSIWKDCTCSLEACVLALLRRRDYEARQETTIDRPPQEDDRPYHGWVNRISAYRQYFISTTDRGQVRHLRDQKGGYQRVRWLRRESLPFGGRGSVRRLGHPWWICGLSEALTLRGWGLVELNDAKVNQSQDIRQPLSPVQLQSDNDKED